MKKIEQEVFKIKFIIKGKKNLHAMRACKKKIKIKNFSSELKSVVSCFFFTHMFNYIFKNDMFSFQTIHLEIFHMVSPS